MKGKIQRHQDAVTLSDITDAITGSDMWVVCTVTENKNGADVSIRESHEGALVNTIALLLEQKEIYNLVQKKIASIKLIKKKQDNPPTNTDIN